MPSYNILLKEVRRKVLSLNNTIHTTAKEYIPQLYHALRNENPNMISQDARERVEKDCLDLWSKRTIINALPDEAKNIEKQNAGKQRHKNKNHKSAAMTAAPKLEEQKEQKIILDLNGRSTYSNEIEDLINENYELKQIIRKNFDFKTANELSAENQIFKIPKDKFSLLVTAIEKSLEYCHVKFDKEKILIDVQSDTVKYS